MTRAACLALCLSLAACNASQGESIGHGVSLFSKALDWTCSAWAGARPLVRSLVPDATESDASAPTPASGGEAP